MIVLDNEYCEEHMLKMVEFAIKNKSLSSLADVLSYLNHYANERHIMGTEYETKCHLTGDMYPNSFGVRMTRKDGPNEAIVFCGGLVYNEDTNQWAVHT